MAAFRGVVGKDQHSAPFGVAPDAVAEGRESLFMDGAQMLLVGEDAPDNEVHRNTVTLKNSRREHLCRIEDLTVGIIELCRVKNIFVDFGKFSIFNVFHLEITDHGLHSPGDIPGKFQEELAGIEGVPILLRIGGETVFGGPQFIPRRNGIGQSVAAEKGIRSVINGAER